MIRRGREERGGRVSGRKGGRERETEEEEWVNDTGLAGKMEQGVEGVCGGERGREEEEEHGRGRGKKRGVGIACV